MNKTYSVQVCILISHLAPLSSNQSSQNDLLIHYNRELKSLIRAFSFNPLSSVNEQFLMYLKQFLIQRASGSPTMK